MSDAYYPPACHVKQLRGQSEVFINEFLKFDPLFFDSRLIVQKVAEIRSQPQV